MHTKNERRCLVCKQNFQKKDLLRIVKYLDDISIDDTNKKNGRGVYLCNNKECISKCIQKKYLNKSFSCAVPDSVYEALRCKIE